MISLEFFKYKWYNTIYACVAQPVVQLIRNEQVAGSNPATSTISKSRTRECSSVGRAGNSLLSLVALLLNYYKTGCRREGLLRLSLGEE